MKKKRDKHKMPLRRVWANNLYMLKIIHRIDRKIIPLRIIMSVSGAVTSFLSSAYLLRYALNAVSQGRSFFDVLWLIVLFMAAEIAVDLLSNAFWYLYYDRRSIDVSRQINATIFAQAKRVELACYENPDYYDKFVKGAAEADGRAFSVLDSLSSVLYTVVSLSLSVGLVISIHPIFLLFSLLPLLTIPLRSKYLKGTFNRDNEIRKVDRQKGYPNRVFYIADYAKELRLTNMGPLLINYLKNASETCRKIHTKKGTLLTIIEMTSALVGDIVPVLSATVYAVYRTLVEKRLGYGDCLVVLDTSARISAILLNSVNVFMDIQGNALYVDNLREFLEYEPTIKDGDHPLPPSGDLVLDNVSFQYEGTEQPTIKNISMRVGAREKIAIVGANGAGKTTLVKLLLRLYDCEGSIRYGDVDIKELALSEYRDIFSVVMQDYHVFALSAKQNVLLASTTENDTERAVKAMMQAGIYDKICEGGGADAIMTREFDDKGIMLSGGEAQKLAISHVYAKKNQFVILDEPSSALDPIAEYNMYETMLDACAECGMIFISHRLSSAVLADRVYLIDNGQVAECGTHQELMALDGQYAAMFRRQAEHYKETTQRKEETYA